MEFGLSDDQKMMQESIERSLERVAPLERVRKAAGREPYAGDVWKALVELGVPGILIPEEFGGLGLNLLDAVLAAEALGRRAQAEAGRGAKPSAKKDADTRALEAELTRVLGLNVEVSHKGGRGALTVRYRTLEQLDDLCRRLRG